MLSTNPRSPKSRYHLSTSDNQLKHMLELAELDIQGHLQDIYISHVVWGRLVDRDWAFSPWTEKSAHKLCFIGLSIQT